MFINHINIYNYLYRVLIYKKLIMSIILNNSNITVDYRTSNFNIETVKSDIYVKDINLENNILKLNIADTLIKNQKTKNSILNNIAYMYLLEDQNMYNNKTFIDKYLQLSSDKEQQREVTEIYNSVKNLNIGNKLPVVELTDVDLNPISIETITANKETVIFFWTSHHLNR